MNARKRADPLAIREAANALADSLRTATGCSSLLPLYEAHVAESRCDAVKASTAYWEYETHDQNDPRSKAAVRERIAELGAWRQCDITIEGLDERASGARIELECSWPTGEVPGAARSACARDTSGIDVRLDRPTSSSCRYRVVAPGYETVQGDFSTQSRLEIKLVRTRAPSAEREANATLASPIATGPALSPEQPPAPPKAPHVEDGRSFWQRLGDQRVGLALGVAGLAGVATGAVFGVLAIHENAVSRDHCMGDVCGPDGAKHRSAAIARADVSTIAFVGGGALLGASVLVYALTGAHEAVETASITWIPSIAPGTGTLDLRGHF